MSGRNSLHKYTVQQSSCHNPFLNNKICYRRTECQCHCCDFYQQNLSDRSLYYADTTTYRNLFSRTAAESESKNAVRRLRALVKVSILFISYDVSGCPSCVDRWSIDAEPATMYVDVVRRVLDRNRANDEQCSAYDYRNIGRHYSKECSRP